MQASMHDWLSRAVADAEHYHRGQVRKGTAIPYMSHLLAVCGLVLEAGGTQTEAIAALLHDAAEDAELPGLGADDVLTAIRVRHGDDVERIVRACSDALPAAGAGKGPWRTRKERYIAHLRTADASTLLVSAADKLHNLRCIYSDWHRIGDAIFERFSAPGDKRATTLWYYRSLYDVYADESTTPDPRRAYLTAPMSALLTNLGG